MYGGGPYLVLRRLMNESRFKKRPKGTWERKLEIEVEEIKKQIKKSSFNLEFPLCILILSFLLLFPGTRSDPNFMKYSIVISFIAFSIAYVCQLIKGRAIVRSPRFKVCNKCKKEDLLGRKECGCGGEFEPPDFFNFIEEVEEEKNIQVTKEKHNQRMNQTN